MLLALKLDQPICAAATGKHNDEMRKPTQGTLSSQVWGFLLALADNPMEGNCLAQWLR